MAFHPTRSPVLVAVAICAAGSIVWLTAAAEPERSPHATALGLVLTHEADVIAGLEADHQAWWHDTRKRQWTVLRPFAPGGVDSTHWFIVSYAIDGDQLAQWNVDTRSGEIRRIVK